MWTCSSVGPPSTLAAPEQAACDRLGELPVHGSHAFLLPWALRAAS
jgi:hypothetical protein